MVPCPSCAVALETTDGVWFCGGCRRALRPMEGFARALGVPADDPRLLMRLTRPIEPRGPCPGCQGGRLLGGVLEGENVAQCSGCRAMWVQGEQMTRLGAAIRPARRSIRPPRGSMPPRTSVSPPAPSDPPPPTSRLGALWNAIEVVSDMTAAVASPIAARAATAPSTPPDVSNPSPVVSLDQPFFDSPAIDRYAYPIAILVGLIVHFTWMDLLVFMTIGNAMHECGHAAVGWLSGIFSTPVPFLTISLSKKRSGVVILMVTAAAGALGFHGWRARRWAELATGAVLLALQVYLTAVLDVAQAREWRLWAGLGGEILWSTLGMLSFYQRLPGRWDFWRFPVMGLSAMVFARSLLMWTRVASGSEVMPHGSAVGDKSEGDVELLVSVYHHTTQELAQGYLTLVRVCALVLLVVYVMGLRAARVGGQAGKNV